jgi:hypothetical protein
MIRRVSPALRRLLPGLIYLVVTYMLVEGTTQYLESLNPPLIAAWPIRPGRAILILASVSWGIGRVSAYHPAYQRDYGNWLASTPWTLRKPLPLGPVALAWEDGAFMATVILLGATLPEPRAMQFLLAFLFANLLTLLPVIWPASWPIGSTTAFGLGLLVRWIHRPIAALAVATLVYLLAYEGVRRSLEKFPWPNGAPPRQRGDSEEEDNVPGPILCGWPYDRLLGEVRDLRPTSPLRALIGCMLFSWWIDCLAVLLTEPRRQSIFLGLASLVALAAPLLRVVAYIQGYGSPLSIWGRIRTFRWIIPGYDRIFIAPLCSLAAGPATFLLLKGLRAPLDVRLSAAYGMVILVAILTPPNLRRWRLTGDHRLLPSISEKNELFIKVG